jgi:predicted Fe-S protein YdhL (DUF1289 family)
MFGVASPCVRNCCLDAEDICVGCFRSLSEIMRWSESRDEEKNAILQRCDLRREERKNRRLPDGDVTS